VNVVLKFLNTYQKKKADQHSLTMDIEGDNIIKVSPYKICNLTGYPILVQRDFTAQQEKRKQDDQPGEELLIQNLVKTNYQIESEIEDMIDQVAESDLQNQYLVKFQIMDAQLASEVPQVFAQINLDRVKVKKHAIKNTSGELFGVYCTVDIIDDRKLLTIASAIVFVNNTAQLLEVQFVNAENTLLPLPRDQMVPVPVNFTRMVICLKLGADTSKYIYLEKISANQDFFYEIEINKLFFILKVEKQNHGSSYTLVSILPPVTLINNLPIDVQMHLLIKGDSFAIPLKLGAYGQHQELQISLSHKLYGQLHFPPMQHS